MKNPRTVKLVVLVALLAAVGSIVVWRTMGSGVPASAIAEEQANQERIRAEMPRPNESAPARGADTPR